MPLKSCQVSCSICRYHWNQRCAGASSRTQRTHAPASVTVLSSANDSRSPSQNEPEACGGNCRYWPMFSSHAESFRIFPTFFFYNLFDDFRWISVTMNLISCPPTKRERRNSKIKIAPDSHIIHYKFFLIHLDSGLTITWSNGRTLLTSSHELTQLFWSICWRVSVLLPAGKFLINLYFIFLDISTIVTSTTNDKRQIRTLNDTRRGDNGG